MSVQIVVTDDVKACLAIRKQVFVEEQGVDLALEIEGEDGAYLHLLALDEGKPVGTLRVTAKGEAAKIERVAVLSSQRGTGVGRAMMQNILNILRDRGFEKAILGSQISALSFYQQLGFVAEGPEFLDAGIKHRMMVAPL